MGVQIHAGSAPHVETVCRWQFGVRLPRMQSASYAKTSHVAGRAPGDANSLLKRSPQLRVIPVFCQLLLFTPIVGRTRAFLLRREIV